MPGERMHPQPRAIKERAHEIVTTGESRITGIPCTMVLTVSFVLSPETWLFCLRRTRDHCPVHLTPALACQDHTTSPSAITPPVKQHCRVHRIPTQRP
jgi:hypothetical protein